MSPANPANPLPDDGWARYAEALGVLHRERDAAITVHRAARQTAAERTAELGRLGARLRDQQFALADLARRLRAPLSPGDLRPAELRPAELRPDEPEPPPPLDGPTAVADLRARVDDADRALAEAGRVAALPQLLPGWTSPFARAAVVYATFAIPSLLLTVFLSMAGVAGNRTVLVWFALVWPAVTAVAGGAVVGRVALPRLRPGQGFGSGPGLGGPGLGGPGLGGGPATTTVAATEPPGASPVSDRLEEMLTRYSPPRRRRYRWFGVLIAWASWLVPGIVLDWFAALWPG